MLPAYEHIAVLVSFVVSLGFAHVLVSAAALTQEPRPVRVSLTHGLWVVVALGCLLDLWLGLYEHRQQARFGIGQIMLLLAHAGSAYLLAALVMPASPPAGEVIDLGAFHREQHRSYIRAFIAFFALDAVSTFVTEPDSRTLLGAVEVGIVFCLLMALPALALFRRERWVQLAAPLVVVGFLVLYWLTLMTEFA